MNLFPIDSNEMHFELNLGLSKPNLTLAKNEEKRPKVDKMTTVLLKDPKSLSKVKSVAASSLAQTADKKSKKIDSRLIPNLSTTSINHYGLKKILRHLDGSFKCTFN